METPISKLSPQVIQRAINAELARPSERTGQPLSAKTIRNEWALISAALQKGASLHYSPGLPTYQLQPKTLPEPQAVMDAVRGTDIEIPVLLALCLGLRISEIRGLRYSDIDGNVLTIRRAMVDTENGPVVKGGKTATSLRKLLLPPFLERVINYTAQGEKVAQNGRQSLIVPASRSQIYGRWQTLSKRAGLSCSLHDLRALNASVMLALGVPDKYAQERGGWASPAVMKRHYQQTLTTERRIFEQTVNDFFEAKYHSPDNSRTEKP